MAKSLTRQDFQSLANERVLEADALLNARRWSGAYYLAGYSVECGLKACIAKLTSADQFPDKDFARACFTHKIEDLVDLAGLAALRDARRKADIQFGLKWNVVKDWDESARYRTWTEIQARKLFDAVTDPTAGALPWIKAHW